MITRHEFERFAETLHNSGLSGPERLEAHGLDWRTTQEWAVRMSAEIMKAILKQINDIDGEPNTAQALEMVAEVASGIYMGLDLGLFIANGQEVKGA